MLPIYALSYNEWKVYFMSDTFFQNSINLFRVSRIFKGRSRNRKQGVILFWPYSDITWYIIEIFLSKKLKIRKLCRQICFCNENSVTSKYLGQGLYILSRAKHCGSLLNFVIFYPCHECKTPLTVQIRIPWSWG